MELISRTNGMKPTPSDHLDHETNGTPSVIGPRLELKSLRISSVCRSVIR
jgi:hypothetical protein